MDVEKTQEIPDGEDLMQPPKTVLDIEKIQFIMNADRTPIDFQCEIQSLFKHEEHFARPRLQFLVNNIYIPKFKAKAFSSYIYGGESPEVYNKYDYSCNKSTLFANAARSKDDVILGIESSFDDSAASLVNSFGEIKVSKQIP